MSASTPGLLHSAACPIKTCPAGTEHAHASAYTPHSTCQRAPLLLSIAAASCNPRPYAWLITLLPAPPAASQNPFRRHRALHTHGPTLHMSVCATAAASGNPWLCPWLQLYPGCNAAACKHQRPAPFAITAARAYPRAHSASANRAARSYSTCASQEHAPAPSAAA